MKKIISAISAAVLAVGGTGLTGASAQEPAKSIVYGDADCDGLVKMNDVVLIMQCLSDADKYSLTTPGTANADVHDRYDGITPLDALAIQRYLLRQGDLPDGYTALSAEQMEELFSEYLCRWLSYYRECKGQTPLSVIENGNTYGRIRAAQIAEDYDSGGELMSSALDEAFGGSFYEEYDMFSELKGRAFLTEVDLNEGDPEIKELDLEEIARNNAQFIVDNESLWKMIGSDAVSGIGAGAKVSEDGRIYFVVFLAGKKT